MTKVKIQLEVEDMNPIKVVHEDEESLALVEFDVSEGYIYRTEVEMEGDYVNIVSREIDPDGKDAAETELTLSARQMEIIAAWYIVAVSTCCKQCQEGVPNK